MRQTDIMYAMVGMLGHPQDAPARPAARRGFTDLEGPAALRQSTYPARHVLANSCVDGYVALMRSLRTELHFERLENLISSEVQFLPGRAECLEAAPLAQAAAKSSDGAARGRVVPAAHDDHPGAAPAPDHRREMATILRRRPDPAVLFICVISARCTTTTYRCRDRWSRSAPW